MQGDQNGDTSFAAGAATTSTRKFSVDGSCFSICNEGLSEYRFSAVSLLVIEKEKKLVNFSPKLVTHAKKPELFFDCKMPAKSIEGKIGIPYNTLIFL